MSLRGAQRRGNPLTIKSVPNRALFHILTQKTQKTPDLFGNMGGAHYLYQDLHPLRITTTDTNYNQNKL